MPNVEPHNIEPVVIPPGEADTYAVVLAHAIEKIKDLPGEKFTLHQLRALRKLLAGVGHD